MLKMEGSFWEQSEVDTQMDGRRGQESQTLSNGSVRLKRMKREKKVRCSARLSEHIYTADEAQLHNFIEDCPIIAPHPCTFALRAGTRLYQSRESSTYIFLVLAVCDSLSIYQRKQLQTA